MLLRFLHPDATADVRLVLEFGVAEGYLPFW